MNKIAIIGGGSWGTALAIALQRSRKPHRIALWVHDPALRDTLRVGRINGVYLPEFELPREIEISSDLAGALSEADIVLGVMPSAHARALYTAMLPFVENKMIFVSATKGLETTTLLRMTQVVSQIIAPQFAPRVAALSGPSFAHEVARGDPTAVVIAASHAELTACIREEFSGPTLRLYSNDDVTGVEIGGAVKNVIAIAAGVCEGLGYGSNTIAALVTRGLAEMTRLSVALGGRRETLAGLAGLGDLVLTATGALSRNRHVGVELGRGRGLEEIVGAMRMVAEGVGTTAATVELARRWKIEMPITAHMHRVLYEGLPPRDAIRELMERPLKQE